MGKRALRVGELVVACNPNQKPGIYPVPLEPACSGAFTFGLYLGGKHAAYDPLMDRNMTFVFVLDSPSQRFGWCWANLIRRAT